MGKHSQIHPGGRFRLKSYVYFGQVDEGVLFEAGRTSFLLPDPKLYPIADKLVQLLDNGHSVDSILERAPDKLRSIFGKLITSLLHHDMLQPLSSGYAARQVRTSHQGEEELYKLLEDRFGGEDLLSAVAGWQSARIALVGSGYALKAAAGALAAAGGRNIRILWTGRASDPVCAEEVESSLVERAPVDACLEVMADGAAVAMAENCDLFLYVSDDGEASSAQACEAILRERGGAGVIAGLFGGQACVAPAIQAGEVGFGELHHWLPSPQADAPSHSPASLSILGCAAAQAALFSFFGLDADKRRGQATLVTPWLEVETHPVVPAPDAVRRHLLPFVHAPRHQLPDERALETFEIVRMSLEPWFDGFLGPLQVAGDDSIRQMPLLQYPVRVRRPGVDDALAIGWGLDLGEAGLRAIFDAVKLLATPCLPPGAVVGVATDEDGWKAGALAEAAIGSPAFAATRRWAWLDLDALSDPSVRILVRLLRFHDRRPLRAELHWSDLGQVCGVRILIGDRAASTAVATSIAAAAYEALGRACSDYQLAAGIEPGFWTGRSPALPPSPGTDPQSEWQDALAVEGRAAPPASFEMLSELGLPPAVGCGFVRLGASA